MADEDLLKNYAIIIPNDIARHSDGSPVMFIKYKEQFLAYCEKEGVDLEPLPVKERERMYKEWETENAEYLKQFDRKW